MRSFEDLQRDFALIEMRNFMVPLKMKLSNSFRPGEDRVEIKVELQVRERDSGKIETITHYRSLDALRALSLDSYGFLSWVHMAVRSVINHEFDEAWHTNDVRVNDPHKYEQGEVE